MYAQLTSINSRTAESPLPALAADAGRPGFSAGFAMTHVAGGEHTVLTLWNDAESAGDGCYEVIHQDFRSGAHGAANIIHFATPISDETRAAAEFAGEHRLTPYARTLDGVGGVVVLWDDRRRAMKAVSFATDLDRLSAVGAALNSMELLPGEDPALLPVVDHVDVFRVAESR